MVVSEHPREQARGDAGRSGSLRRGCPSECEHTGLRAPPSLTRRDVPVSCWEGSERGHHAVPPRGPESARSHAPSSSEARPAGRGLEGSILGERAARLAAAGATLLRLASSVKWGHQSALGCSLGHRVSAPQHCPPRGAPSAVGHPQPPRPHPPQAQPQTSPDVPWRDLKVTRSPQHGVWRTSPARILPFLYRWGPYRVRWPGF